jgi:hypothetical protein
MHGAAPGQQQCRIRARPPAQQQTTSALEAAFADLHLHPQAPPVVLDPEDDHVAALVRADRQNHFIPMTPRYQPVNCGEYAEIARRSQCR